MNRSKSIFLTLAITLWTFTSIWAIYSGINNSQWYFGLLLASLLPTLFIGQLFIFKTPRTSRNLNWILILVFVGFAWELNQYILFDSSFIALELSFVSMLCWGSYIYWYSVFPSRNSEQLTVGKQLAKLQFIGSKGEDVFNDQFEGRKLIYLFYRGNWCPLCMAQISEISEKYREINEMGAEVLLISPQPHKFTQQLAKRRNVAFQFLQDRDGEVAKQLGIFVNNGTPIGLEVLGYETDTVLPTVIITDEKGKILYADQTDNYRVRPEPDTFIEVLRNA